MNYISAAIVSLDSYVDVKDRKERNKQNMILKIKKRHSQEWFFLAILYIYVSTQLISASTLDYMLPNISLKIVKCVVLLGAIFSILTNKKYSLKRLIIMVFIAIVLMIMLVVGNYFIAIAIPLLLALASDVTDYKSILKCIVLSVILTTATVIALCALNIIPDYTYTHKMGDVVRTAHSCGFKYYSSPGYICMTVTAIYLYQREDISFLKLGIIELVSCGLYLVHTNQTAIIFSTLLLVAYIVTRKIKVFSFTNKFWRFVSIITPSFLCFGTFELINLYKKGILILPSYFGTLSGRLFYSVRAINEYGISLFGTKVAMYGVTQLVYGNAKSAFYIDSGFLYSFIAYGVVCTILIVLIYTLIYRYVASIGDGFSFVWMGGILALCVINNYLLSCYANPFIFLLPYALRSTFRNDKKDIF